MPTARLLAAVAAATLAGATTAFTDEVGVPAKVVKLLEKPGKAVAKIVWKDASGAIHKGAAGPATLSASVRMCLTEDPAGFGERTPLFSFAGPFQVNTDEMAKFASSEGEVRRLVVKPGVSAKAVLKSDVPLVWFSGLTGIVAWPPQGGSAALLLTNANDASTHLLCSDLAGAGTVVAREIAGGAGRKIVWKDVPADPGCAIYDAIEVSAGCSPSGAFLD